MKIKTLGKITISIFSLIALAALIAGCSGGGNDDESSSSGTPLSGNACEAIGLTTKILNGTSCSEQGSPVVEILLKETDGKVGLCTGTLISSKHIITAAHCFDDEPQSAVVQVNGVTVSIVKAYIHSDYNEQTVDYDVAIGELNTDISGITPSAIMANNGLSKRDVVKIFGYGLAQESDPSSSTAGTLRSGEMRVDNVKSSEFTAVYETPGSNTCFGDSGGPAYFSANSQIGLVGVTSAGTSKSCGLGETSFFTNLQDPKIVSFIQSVAPQANIL